MPSRPCCPGRFFFSSFFFRPDSLKRFLCVRVICKAPDCNFCVKRASQIEECLDEVRLLALAALPAVGACCAVPSYFRECNWLGNTGFYLAVIIILENGGPLVDKARIRS